MKYSEFPDPFENARLEKGCSEIDDQNDPVLMLLRLKDVRKSAHNWKRFSSEADPGRIVVPSEVDIRDTRQIPFELDPPLHGSYRALMEDWFKRPLKEVYQEKLSEMVKASIAEALSREQIELVSEFALPLQSRALTLLLNIPYEEAETWISWGTHVFRSEETALDADKANILYDYIDKEIDKAIEKPDQSLYSVLLKAEINGRKLSKEEVKGTLILTFAGGRDTIINAVTNTLVYLAEHPQELVRINKEPEILNSAVEELIRYFSPLTHMGRVAKEETQVCEHAVKADSRISLCWASANRDSRTFENPNKLILDRKINPHVGFGFSHHKCLGATHARQLLKILLRELSKSIQSIDILGAEENIENWGDFNRKVGFDKVEVRFNKKDPS